MNPGRLWRTVRHLQPIQIRHQITNRLRRLFGRASRSRDPFALSVDPVRPLLLSPFPPHRTSLDGERFTFLNRPKAFSGEGGIDWNFSEFGKLWLYNLTYFDYLLQQELPPEKGYGLIRDFLAAFPKVKDGLEPYPLSLRLINWVFFLSTYPPPADFEGDLPGIRSAIKLQADLLADNLEYHILANHLLENGFALCFAGAYLDDAELLERGRTVVAEQLKEQVLGDGGHFERSPMYHQIILRRVLDLINLLQNHAECREGDFSQLLKKQAGRMLAWLENVTFGNGEIPLVNDAAKGIAPETATLKAYAKQLGVMAPAVPLGESGFRMLRREGWELFVDLGSIGPAYQPGHAHSGALSFVLFHGGKKVVQDTGVSTYEKNARRELERGTAAHNTVQVGDLEQSEMWGGFRVGRRARVFDLASGDRHAAAAHDGYLAAAGVIHRRRFFLEEARARIIDLLEGKEEVVATARIHFRPGPGIRLEGEEIVVDGLRFHFKGAQKVTLEHYRQAPEFNTLIPAQCAEVRFSDALETVIEVERE